MLRPIAEFRVVAKCIVTVDEFPLRHGAVDRLRIAWGTGELLGKPAMVVATADPGEGSRVSLYEMSKALKFGFDKVSLKKGVYSPRAHGELETDQFLLRKFLLELMEGKRAMWTGVFTGERPLQMEVAPAPHIQQRQPQPQAPGDAGAPAEARENAGR